MEGVSPYYGFKMQTTVTSNNAVYRLMSNGSSQDDTYFRPSTAGALKVVIRHNAGDSYSTWSLIGTENLSPITSKEAQDANFTNEGGIEYRYRFLKNIMGMWLFQNVRKNLDKKFTYDEMMHLAMESGVFEEIDTNAQDFVAPENMITAIRNSIKNDNLPIEVVINTIYHSLAKSYKKAVDEMEKISGKKINTVNIVGGGSKDTYLNKLTAQYTGKCVMAGPVEATAIGNLLSQIMYRDKTLTLEKAREVVKKSFNISEVM